jgi:hypothetical protein
MDRPVHDGDLEHSLAAPDHESAGSLHNIC